LSFAIAASSKRREAAMANAEVPRSERPTLRPLQVP
jgi:hypothetical protein